MDNVDIFIGTYKDFKSQVSNESYKVIYGKRDIKITNGLKAYKCVSDRVLDDRFYSEIYMLRILNGNFDLKDYVGFCHYRKYFDFMDNIPNLDEIFSKGYDAIVAAPINLKISVKKHYSLFHNIEDLYIVGGIIADKFPSYSKMFSAFINGKMIIPYNMFIMKKNDFKEYIEFVGSVLDEYVNIVGKDIESRINNNKDKYLKSFSPNNTVEYQYRIGGYLAERLTNIFMLNKFNKLKTYKVKITEDKY